MKQTQLLCTFTDLQSQTSVLEKIRNSYILAENRVFLFENVKNPQELVITYNIKLGNIRFVLLPNTISVHRKQQTNTLYTLNALNKIIMEENNGILNKDHMIDWKLYTNCLIITTEMGYKITELSFIGVQKI